jgi:hypothetical protein
LNQYTDKESLLQAISQTQYLTGLTRTGAAIQHMVLEGFSERRGARPIGLFTFNRRHYKQTH